MRKEDYVLRITHYALGMSIKPSPTPSIPSVNTGTSRLHRAVPGKVATRPRGFWATTRRLRWTEFRLLLTPAVLSLVGMLTVILVPTGQVQWQWRDLWMSFVFIGLLYGVHFWLDFTRPHADQVLLPIVAVLMAIGLVMIQRLEPALVDAISKDFEGIARKQVIWMAVGVAALWVTVTFVRDLNWL